MARPEKVSAVQEITEKFEGAEAALLTEYRGLKVSEIAEVREALRGADTEYRVLKNTLARIAVREVGLEELADQLTGPTAIAFVKGDIAAAAKALDEATKKFPVLIVKGGTLKGGKIFDADQAKALAKIEPREVLLAKIAMLANSPAQQAANVLSALLRNLGSMLAQVQTKKDSGELPGGAGETAEAPAAEAPAAEEAAEAPAEETSAAEAETAATDEPAAEAAETPEAANEADAGQGGDAAGAAEAPAASADEVASEEVGQPNPEGDTPEEQAESTSDDAVTDETPEDSK